MESQHRLENGNIEPLDTDAYDMDSNDSKLENSSREQDAEGVDKQRVDGSVGAKNEEKSEHEFEVRFEGGDDEEDVVRISRVHKWAIVIVISITSVCITSMSSAWSLASEHIMERFNVSHTVSTLGISLFLWGLGTGSMFLSPISEFHGRRPVYIVGLGLTLAFEFLTAFSSNFGGMLFGRFMSGFFGSSFLSVASGTFSDLFKRRPYMSESEKKKVDIELANSLVLYASCPFIGPGVGPLMSGFVNSYLNFRWTFHIMIMWTAVVLMAVILFVPETFEPVLLTKKAKRLRKQKEDDRYHSPLERSPVSLYESILISSKRPLLLICKDFMTMVLCFYTSFTLAIVYLFFVAIPYSFHLVYGFSVQSQGLSFIGLVVGMGLTSLLSPKFFQKQCNKLIEKNGGVSKPEFRFLPLMVGVFVVPIGLFMMAWTTYESIHWIVPIIGSAIYGSATILVFNGIMTYTVEAYRQYTASAIAANTFTRTVIAGILPLFGLQMYRGMGIHWATTFLALFALLLIPIPFVFYKYGESWRRRSPYTWTA